MNSEKHSKYYKYNAEKNSFYNPNKTKFKFIYFAYFLKRRAADVGGEAGSY
jgi:hypothetical protein